MTETPGQDLSRKVLNGYGRAAPDLVERYEAISSAELLKPVARWFPASPAKVLDVGAGTGRDAAWFTSMGHDVLAVEPVAAFRSAGAERHSGLTWVDDRLPRLARVEKANLRFDLILSNGVLHHLAVVDQLAAMDCFQSLLAANGRLILSLRNGPGSQDRPAVPVSKDALVNRAADRGMSVLFQDLSRPSVQPGNRAAGVTWDWLVFGQE